MRVPYSWLREVVAAGAPDWDVAPAELEQTLIRIGHEVEEVIELGPVDGPLTVGRVTDIEELTGFKKPIRFCHVDVGDDVDREIVCGATNFVAGDLVVVALPGTTLPGGFAIAARKTYGRNSDGMICSAAELGLGADHSGILVLPPGTAEPGADGAAVLGLDDVIFHLAITPDRGYCMSLRGLAREIACAYDLEFVDPADVKPLPVDGQAWPLTVQPDTGVRRFALRPVTGIDPAAVSPWWLQRRLLLSGIRATSPAVDVTNYVMLELGHPMHAHDRNRISGGLGVRFARPGETVVTLDDIERKLEPVDVLIVDDAATAAIGGVMGAASTEVRADSTDVLLEAAVWDPAAVSRTQRRLHLPSEAARRYERGVDPAISVAALDALTDWRGEPACDGWSPPAIQMPADLHRRRRHVDGGPAQLAARPAAAGRPGRACPPRSAAAAPSGGRWPSPVTSRSCPPRSCRRACWTCGDCRTTTRGAAPPRCSTRWRPTARIWPPRCCPRCWKPWCATCLAAWSTSPSTRWRRWCSRQRKPVRCSSFRSTAGPPTPRSRSWTRRCRGNPSTSPRC